MGTELKFTPRTQLHENADGEEFLTSRPDGPEIEVRCVPARELRDLAGTADCRYCLFWRGACTDENHEQLGRESGCVGVACAGVYWLPVTTYLTLKLVK